MRNDIIAHKVKAGLSRIANIKNIIAVTSGKGGVGKSTTAINLAIAMSKTGAAVGLLDADIYGPSVPMLVGERGFKPDVADTCFVPLEKYGIKILSFGFLIGEKQPAIWRGAIVNKALDQLMFDTKWGELDYLVIDMPPGTGDIHLTMCQKMPITGVVSVTTPQDIALLDVTKSVEMYKKLGITCLGVIENMSTHICSICGHVEAIFGDNGGDKLSATYNLPILAKLPLNINIRQSSDNGIPIAFDEANPTAKLYAGLASAVETELAKLPKDYSAKIGKVSAV
ncbi:MAG: iron-sulfur cluster carrier protein ApbC [Burkholderiales bacterium]|jgi:ATP-binding protein involved in chromosome partitioning|nr:iron-sulfur cluster carrier protein ApbC [Burkholderiales bacterium]